MGDQNSPIGVMMVDDSEETRQSIKMLLRFAEGIEVVGEAADGAEALRKIQLVNPDVVLMDINMPIMDGVEATGRMRELYPCIPVIMLSVQNDVEYVRAGMAAGARDYLFKPVSIESLKTTIENVHQRALVHGDVEAKLV